MARPSGPGAESTPAAPTSTSTETGSGQAKGRRSAHTAAVGQPLVISSPRKRALVTAELAGLTVDEVNPLIREWDYGDYEGDHHQIRKAVPNWLVWTHGCPGR